MDTCQANSREYQRQTIDADIKSLEESIRSLRHRRNALAPISSLPAEVISTIFSLLRVPVSPSPLAAPPTPSEKLDHLPWLRLSHVCRHWREIALDQPLFWNHLHFDKFSLAGAAEMLARAKMVPLHLEARVSDHWDDARFGAFQKEIRMHASHLCHLDIIADLCHFPDVVKGLISPAPILEYLSLVCDGFPNRAMSSGECIPDTLFDGTTPKLSCLKLRRCNISWEAPYMKGLRSLEIHYPSPSARPSLSVWLDTLDRMPRLQMLILHEASPIALPAPLPSGIKRTITHPSLSILDFSASARDCGLALAHLILPALTLLCLAVRSELEDGSDVQQILPYVSQHASGFPHTQSMVIRDDKMCTDMLAWADVRLPKPVDFLDDMPSSPLAFSFMDQWSPEIRTAVLDAAIAALPLDNLLALTLHNHMSHFEKQVWLFHAPRWPLLQRVCLSRSAVRGYMEMLLEDNGGRENPLLPSLTTLVLDGAELSARWTLRLCDVLMKRVEQRVPLEVLDLQACLATSRAVDLLSEIVVDVLGPVQTLQQRANLISVWDAGARGAFVRDTSYVMGEYDLDPGSDGDVWDNWDMDDEEGEEGEEEARDEEDYW